MNLRSSLEDTAFSIIQHLPVVPGFLMNWMNDYVDKQIVKLQHETVRQQWDKVALEKTVSEIHRRQNTEKAPSED